MAFGKGKSGTTKDFTIIEILINLLLKAETNRSSADEIEKYKKFLEGTLSNFRQNFYEE